jgi:hypothetical protein
MTDFRALCAELLDELDFHSSHHEIKDLKARARTALAEGAGVGPTDDELWKLFDAEGGNPEDWGWTLVFLRAILARYGTHPRPIPVAERLPTAADCDVQGRCLWLI